LDHVAEAGADKDSARLAAMAAGLQQDAPAKYRTVMSARGSLMRQQYWSAHLQMFGSASML
jgi:hypothetical protein